MSKPKLYHEKLNMKGKIKRFSLQAAIASGLATALLVIGSAQLDAEAMDAVAPMIGLSFAAAVAGGLIFKAIPEKYITLTLATQTTVRVQ